MWQKAKNVYHLFVAVFFNIVFWFPGHSLKVIGVTGTDGKTTTTSLIYHILQNSGRKVSLLGSVEAKILDRKYDTELHRTTPSSSSLQKFLRKAVGAGSEYFVLEVTSHAIDQNRIWGIPFEVGALTNVTKEHLDYHKTYENYLFTKAKLLKVAKMAIVNADDNSYSYLKEIKGKEKNKIISYGLLGNADVGPDNYPAIQKAREEFNKYNFLAAASVCQALGLAKKEIEEGISSFKLPLGRMEEVYSKEFRVIVDFAHTPNAFESVLTSLRPQVKGRIIHVFGSAGERDRSKRSVMGSVSSKYADVLILTSEDPRKENIEDINSQIEAGVKNPKATVIKVPDRKEAISAAVQMAGKDDLILITGKAHERSINYGRGEQPWDEFQAVREALATT